MSAAKLQLRVKHKGGQAVISSLDGHSTVKQLKDELEKLTNIPAHQQKVLRGYPPAPVDLGDANKSLSSCNFQDRDTLLVEGVSQKEQPSVPSSEGQSPLSNAVQQIQSNPSRSGIILRQVVPSDNSCLFASIGFCLSGKQDSQGSKFMRELVACTISSQPDLYSDAILGKPKDEYCKWILKDESWGGGIELSILSSYYGIEIDVVNTQHGSISRFGEDQNYGQRILLIYDGIHYDPLYMEPFSGGNIQTIFPLTDGTVLEQAEELAAEARASHQYTDVEHFTLKCLVCQVFLRGQVQAQQHAKETGHASFGEVQGTS